MEIMKNLKIFLTFFVLTFFVNKTTFTMLSPVILSDGSFFGSLDNCDKYSLKLENLGFIDLFTGRIFDILNEFNESMFNWLINDQLWIYKASPDTIIENIFDCHFQSEFDLPYIVKWLLPKKTKVVVCGDIHGNFSTLNSILYKMLKENIIDSSLHIKDGYRFVFLGDYVDRGLNNLKVLLSLIVLVLKNPGKVILLRGNHENRNINIKYANNIFAEISQLVFFDKKISSKILNGEILKAYHFLPVALLLGFQGQDCTKFQLLCHGGPDIKFDYKDILEYKAEKFSKNGGICLYQIFSEDDVLEEEIEEIFGKDKVTESCWKEYERSLENKGPGMGFLWNDIFKGEGFDEFFRISLNNRLGINHNFLPYLFNHFDSPKAKIVGIVRGHDHKLPKEIEYEMFGKKMSFEGFCRQYTSPCFVFYNDFTFLPFKDFIYDLSAGFSTITLMGGPVSSFCYPPAFLLMDYADSWRIQAVYD